MLEQIRNPTTPLSAAHARIAMLILSRPEEALRLSIAELARDARVSEPTVIRFCRQLGFQGYKTFRQAALRDIAGEKGDAAAPKINGSDSVEVAAAKSVDATIRSLERLRRAMPMDAIRNAATAILKARWVHVYGFGASATVAADAQHKLYRLAAMTVAYADAHMQAMAASTLGAEDVVIAISSSGATRELIETVRLARGNGATIVALTRPGSPLAALASVLLPVTEQENREIFTPMTTRIVQLALIDALVVGVTLLSPATMVSERLARMDAAIKQRRIASSPISASPADEGSA
ncbi:transcriptional regulator, RpiR family [Rhizobiales bacterium GAS188]|nr:transcriptional regulator, RpiR family [Rhizobiales bacterium GAS188]